jgi:non-specific serine/threonine protein kinase
MDPDRSDLIATLLKDASALAPGDRAAFLDSACGEDGALRSQVETLLGVTQAEPPTGRLESGFVLAGRYRVDAEIGAGGMGRVYRATQIALGREVAVKVLADTAATAPAALQRFEREASIVARLRHPNLVTIYDAGSEPGVGAYIVMELVSGRSLADELADRGRLTVVEVVDVMRQVADAVHAAHALGVIHRDLKPHNVMLVRGDEGSAVPRVLDFGLAKTVDKSDSGGFAELSLTQSGMVFGTPLYMSPEQARDDALDARTDVWSMGVMLYELLTGEAPFRGSSPVATFVAILHDKPAPIESRVPAVPPALASLVERTLSKDPAGRPATAGELAAELERIGRAITSGTVVETLPLEVPTLPETNLPPDLEPLIGRDAELRALADVLRRHDSGVVTLTGPGGTGKTRLALAAARELLTELGGGAFFVDLSAVRDPALVVPAAARELGVAEAAGVSPEAAIVARVGDRPTLVVLDNFEQVVDAAPVVARLAEAAPALWLLVTSRVLLRLPREREVALAPLALPPPDRLPSVSELGRCASVALFVARARDARKSFELTERNAAAVAEICRRLDGLPLAVELAAARLKLLSPESLLARLDERLRLLTSGSRDLPERQQTMRAAVAWSDDLLEEGERRVFYRLSVFAGGCTVDAAEAVCGGEAATEVLDALEALVESSLLAQQEMPDGDVRFRMLEVVREYARERLAAAGESEAVERRHAETFLALAETALPEIRAQRSVSWLGRLEAEHDNLRLALATWHREDPERFLALAAALAVFWSSQGHLVEGRRWLAAALERGADAPPELRIKAMYQSSTMALQMGDRESARRQVTEVTRLAEAIGDTPRLAAGTYQLGVIDSIGGDLAAARAHFERSLAIGRETGNEGVIEHCLNSLGEVARMTGDFATARDFYEQAVAMMRGGTNEILVIALMNLGAVACEEGDFAEARARYAEALEIARDVGSRPQVSLALDGLAAVAAGRSEWRRAGRLAGAAEALRAKLKFAIDPVDQALRDRTLEAVRAGAGEAAFAETLAEGRALSADDAIREALDD